MIDLFTSYMRGRLTLDKINAAVDEMATFAAANARLLTAPKQKACTNSFDAVDWMSLWISSFRLAKF
jgi:hypothetical protein